MINRRGTVIPVVDLRERFGMVPADVDGGGDAARAARAAALRCMVVLEVAPDDAECGDARVAMGVVVDCVSDVVAIDVTTVEDAPGIGAAVRTEFLLGMATSGPRVRLLLDIDRVLAPREVDEVARAA